MKKIVLLSVFVMGIIGLTSCGGGSSTPGDALKSYMECMQSQDFDGVVEGIYFGEKTEADAAKLEQARTQFAALLKEKGAKQFEKNGGLKDVVIVSETIAEDGNSATVEYKQIWGNGKEETSKQQMVKKDGKWMMEMKK